MTPTRFASLAIGDRVTVRQFGEHVGTVEAINPVVTIQGKAAVRAGWICVRLDDGREFNGAFSLVRFGSATPRRRAA